MTARECKPLHFQCIAELYVYDNFIIKSIGDVHKLYSIITKVKNGKLQAKGKRFLIFQSMICNFMQQDNVIWSYQNFVYREYFSYIKNSLKCA
jgi:hypothetical protein